MDTFFQKLRDIQNKERNTGTLSEIDDSFYNDASNYLQELLKMVNNNPLSLEAYQLRDAQRITTEICERREFKIVSTAATNVQKAHDIFKGHKKDSELYDVIPYNTTPEEEEFYRKIVDMMINHREHLMEKIIINKTGKTKIGFKPTVKEEIKEVIPSDVETQKDDDESSVEIGSTPDEAVEKAPIKEKETSLKPKPPLLDESQIAMMFGQAPDDVLLDENNNPIKPVKRDITTPFKGPKAPKNDTVSLQNKPNEEEKIKEVNENNSEKNQESETVNDSNSNSDITKDLVKENTFNDVELVTFKKEINTDILDENEKTYGPFIEGDIVSLPKSLVEILNMNDVITIIS